MPEFAEANEGVTSSSTFPKHANGQTHVEDRKSGLGVDITLVGANATAAQVVGGYVVYPRGHALGSVYQRAEPSGVEDYLALEERPASPSIAYEVKLGPHVAGLRLVANQLEMLDANGVPRLRLAPPYVVGNDGARTDALLAVEGCAVDTDPAGPWGRSVKRAGPNTCRIVVSWSNDRVSYPAILDPRWQTTDSMSVARQDHNLMYLPLTGKVLAVGGRSSSTSTSGLASAELFDSTTRTWSATTSMSGGRWSASATLLGSSANSTTSQKVLIAGGINGTASVNTAQLYNQTTGTWGAAGTLNAPRHLHSATLLSDGRVLVCGGMNGTTLLTSAALYNPASGSGSWAATTGPIPPPGWRSGTATLIKTSNSQLNNKVLLAGGNNGTGTISSVFLFDPAQSAFSTLASMPSPREGHQAVALSDGRILFAGGKNGSTYLASAVIFDPSWGPGTWNATGTMTSPRWGHAMNLLPSGVLTQGLVLVSGGSNGASTLSSTEYWNGINWATDGSMVAPVQQHASVALGKSLLIAGGAINNGSTTVSATEIYDPSIGLGCTSGSQCASGFCVSGVCCDSACTGGCGACNLAGHVGICTPVPSGPICRPAAGFCDAAETCDGISAACPADKFQPSTMECRPSAGVCDMAESCTGASATCPSDRFQPDGTVCNDEDACTTNDKCTAGACHGLAYTCDDHLSCTSDTCNGDGTCTYGPVEGTCYLDGSCFRPNQTNPNNQCEQCTPEISYAAWSPTAAGTTCNDGSACTKLDQCDGAGACAGTPFEGMGCNIHLLEPAVAKMEDGSYIGIFGYKSEAKTSFRPTENTVSPPLTESPYPPAFLLPGTHVGAFLPKMIEGQTITWNVDGDAKSVTANSANALKPQTKDGKTEVNVGGTTVVIGVSIDQYLKEPATTPEELPSGKTFRGTLKGSLSVSPSGAALYTVPISIPPGIGGMAPNLSLVYNSQGGNGIAGQGWELAGLSTIHRCPKTLAEDGYGKPVTLSPIFDITSPQGDGVCLDGKRLFVQEDSEDTTGFAPELADFAEITYDKLAKKFKVVTKTGETRSYGARSNSQVKATVNGVFRPTVIWALDRVYDVWGNYYDLIYNYGQEDDFGTQGLFVTSIKYTGHLIVSGKDVIEDTPTFNEITLTYEDRTEIDPRSIRFGSWKLPKNKRLTTIKTGDGGGVYTLNYLQDNELNPMRNDYRLLPSLLDYIRYCPVGSTVCLQDLKFDWDGGGYGWDPLPPGVSPTSQSKRTHDFALPAEITSRVGLQFVDLDADGRLDLVKAEKGGQSGVWWNTGTGWKRMPETWNLPGNISLAEANSSVPYFHQENKGTIFADFDGDGLPDLITDTCVEKKDGSPTVCHGTAGHPAVFLNRLLTKGEDKSEGKWEFAEGFSGSKIWEAIITLPHGLDWTGLDLTKDRIADVNGDGFADLVGFHQKWQVEVFVLLSNGSGWIADSRYATTCDFGIPENMGSFYPYVSDLNRDGLSDLECPGIPSTNKLNTGNASQGNNGTIWIDTGVTDEESLGEHGAKLLAAKGDIDGDGLYDEFEVAYHDFSTKGTGPYYEDGKRVRYSSGMGWTGTGWQNVYVPKTNPDPYVSSLDDYDVGENDGSSGENWRRYHNFPPYWIGDQKGLSFIDVNADGLVDVLVEHYGLDPNGRFSAGSDPLGQVLVNTGRIWKDIDKYGRYAAYDTQMVGDLGGGRSTLLTEHAAPYGDAHNRVQLDLNGDGVPDMLDRVLSPYSAWPQGAWLNKFRPPVIKGFPAGFAKDTAIKYVVISTAEARDEKDREKSVYAESTERARGTRYHMLPLRVVASVEADDGVGGTATTGYRYRDLRASQDRRGPQGFKQVIVTEPNKTETTTTYSQSFPFTGMPTDVVKKNEGVISSSHTDYNELEVQKKLLANERGIFVHPELIRDIAYVRDSDESGLEPDADGPRTTVTTEYDYDSYGNPKQTKVTTTQSFDTQGYERIIVNAYTEGALHAKRGKPDSVTVTTNAFTMVSPDGEHAITDSREHVTSYEYFDGTSALKTKMVELGAGPPLENWTTYEYDKFGNVITTTACASDFTACEAGQPNPMVTSDMNDPEHPSKQHPAFRTTRISYDPTHFDPKPAGMEGIRSSLDYGIGRFPVRTTTSVGGLEQVSYSAYDPWLGVLVQSTGPDGVQTCHTYDKLGYKMGETARCGSDHPLPTTIARYLVASDSRPAFAKTLVITTAPNGSASGAYADALGRTIDTFSQHFSGALVHTSTVYNNLGQVYQVWSPHLTLLVEKLPIR